MHTYLIHDICAMMVSTMEKNQRKGVKENQGRAVILNGLGSVREGLTDEKVASEWRLKKVRGWATWMWISWEGMFQADSGYLGRECFREIVRQVQRPWGKCMPSIFEQRVVWLKGVIQKMRLEVGESWASYRLSKQFQGLWLLLRAYGRPLDIFEQRITFFQDLWLLLPE